MKHKALVCTAILCTLVAAVVWVITVRKFNRLDEERQRSHIEMKRLIEERSKKREAELIKLLEKIKADQASLLARIDRVKAEIEAENAATSATLQ